MLIRDCANDTCTNKVDADKSSFCSDECKAKYWGTTVDRLQSKVKIGPRKSLKEWQEEFRQRAKKGKNEKSN